MFRKSQIAVMDLLIALFIATILIVLIVFVWNRYAVTLNENTEYNEMKIIAFQASDLLVKTKGKPENWEDDVGNVKVLGLASHDRNLSIDKVSKMDGVGGDDISYADASKVLGTGFYDFYLQIKYVSGTDIVNYGTSVPPDKSIVSVRRFVEYNNEKAILEFTLWKK